MSNRTLRLAGAALLGALATGPVLAQTALMSAPVAISPRRAVTVGSGENEMVIYIEEVRMTPARR